MNRLLVDPGNLALKLILKIRGLKILQIKYSNHLKILGARRVRKFVSHGQTTNIRRTVQTLVVRVT